MTLESFRQLQQTEQYRGKPDSVLVNQLRQEDLLALQDDLRRNHHSEWELMEAVGSRLVGLEHVHG